MLIAGQTYETSCPYFWGFCSGSTCDGCEADRGQGRPASTPPWASGTTIEQRHSLANEAAHAETSALSNELYGDLSSWRRHILGAQ